MAKAKLCKECQKKRDAIDWRTFPNRLPHYVWADGRKVFHFTMVERTVHTATAS